MSTQLKYAVVEFYMDPWKYLDAVVLKDKFTNIIDAEVYRQEAFGEEDSPDPQNIQVIQYKDFSPETILKKNTVKVNITKEVIL